MIRQLPLILLIHLVLASIVSAQENVTTVILVRHAEKASTGGDDPQLTDHGTARAESLMKMLENSGVSAIYATQYARTKLTVQPLAKKLGLDVQVVDANATQKLVDTILTQQAGKTVVVSGHSNTLPEIVAALGAGDMPEIQDDDYNNLLIVTVFAKGKAKLLPLRFFTPL